MTTKILGKHPGISRILVASGKKVFRNPFLTVHLLKVFDTQKVHPPWSKLLHLCIQICSYSLIFFKNSEFWVALILMRSKILLRYQQYINLI